MLDGLYDQNGSPAFAKNLKKLKGIVDKYDKKLILIISPVSCYEGEKLNLCVMISRFLKTKILMFIFLLTYLQPGVQIILLTHGICFERSRNSF